MDSWLKRSREIIVLIGAVVAGLVTAAGSIPEFVDRLQLLLRLLSENTVVTIVAALAFLLIMATGLLALYLIRTRITDAASSLGYSASQSSEADRVTEKMKGIALAICCRRFLLLVRASLIT
jgi:hypothetical protein